MSVLEIDKLRFSYKDKELFNDLSVRIFDNEHIGIVGLNGTGKTTLMKLIAGQLIPDSGTITWDSNKSFSYLDQHLEVHSDQTIEEYLYSVYNPLFQKENQMNDLYSSLAEVDESKYDKILNKAYNIQEELEQSGFYEIKSRIGNIINGLGIQIEENRLLKELSSGQRAKVFLGKMLLEEKDIILLDEPTNFLDLQHVEWLSKFLVNYKNTFLVISHNFEFLNSCCNVILALENKKLTKYKGNYDQYLKQRDMNLETYQKEYEKQQKEIKRTEEFIQKNIVRASTTKQAQSRRKQLERMEKLEKPVAIKDVHFKFPFSASFNSEALTVRKLQIGYTKPILPPIDLKIIFGEKVVIIGANGVGKSTFIKTILGIIPEISGNVKMPFYNKPLYFEQEYNGKMDINAVDFFKEKYPAMIDTKIRDILGKYGIVGELAIKKLSELSGGELTKVRFARLSLESSNMLILDEPTNHLDKNAKNALFKAMSEYPGTIILVSHEKDFYKKLNMKEIHFR